MSFHLKTFPNQPYTFEAEKAHNSFIFDSNGNKYLDLTAGGTSFSLIGSGNKRVHNAIANQLNKFEHLDCKTFDDKNREYLSEILLTSSNVFKNDKKKVFFSGGSGSEAIEMSMHLSYQYHRELGRLNKKWFISRNQSYHGATSGSLSIGERPNLEFYRPLQSNFRARISECNYKKNKKNNESEMQYTKRLLLEFEDLIKKIGPENIAAFVGETILGGLVGDVPPTKNYWKGIRKICTENNIHLILDEVWCGTGASGKYYCFEYDGIVPDFVVLGKTLGCGYIPISCVIVPSLFESIVKENSGRIEMSCTFQAHSLAVASALEVQKIITEKGFIEEVYKKGNFIREELEKRLGKHPYVKDIRGRGIRNSVEYDCYKVELFSKELSRRLYENHSIIISSKWHRTSLSHAMNLSWEQITFYLERYESVFNNLADNWEKEVKRISDNKISYF